MRSTAHRVILSDSTDAFVRNTAINFAIGGFLLHLMACVLYSTNILRVEGLTGLTDSFLDSLYTPFSIILAYEVYELIRAIPESFSNSGSRLYVSSLS